MQLFVSTPVDQSSGPYRRRWWALLVLCLSLLIIVMANTALIVAAPDMTRDLGLDSSELQWVIDAYTVPYAALMLLLGAVGDKYSRRAGLIVGLVIFGAGSVMGSLVDSSGAVIGARAIMGLGAALIMPATLSLLVSTFPRSERAKAITVWTATSGLGVAFGPLIAGWLLESHSWSSTFLINVPIALVGIVGALIVVPPSRAQGMGKIDLVGGLLSMVAIGALVYCVIEGPHFGWGKGPIAGAVVAGLGFAAFVWWELRHPHPVLDVRKFRDRAFSGSTIAVLMFFLGTFGAIYYMTQHLQFVQGFSALETGFRMLPLAAGVCLGAAVTGRMTPLLGMRTMVISGMAIGTLAVTLLTQVDSGSGYGNFLASFILLGFAVGLSVSPCTDTIMGSFPENELGVGGGVNDTALELGGSLGIAVLGSLLATSYRDNLTDSVGNALPPEALEVARDSIGGALAVAEKAAQSPGSGPAQAKELVSAANSAFSDAIATTSLVAAVIMGAGTVIVMALLPGSKRNAGRATEAEVDAAAEATEGKTPVG